MDSATNYPFLTDLATELAKQLLKVVQRAYGCRSTAAHLQRTVESLLPLVHRIRYSGVEMDQVRQRQLSELAGKLGDALELCKEAEALPRWNVYRSVQLARKMEKIEKWITKWTQRQMPAHILADVHILRVESDQRISRIERQIEQLAPPIGQLAPPIGLPIQKGEQIGTGIMNFEGKGEQIGTGIMNFDVKGEGIGIGIMDFEGKGEQIGMGIINFEGKGEELVGFGARVGREKVKEMVMRERGGNWGIVGISGIGGSGKTTLAREICGDLEIRAHFNERIYFETVSQSPNIETLKLKLWQQISQNTGINPYNQIPDWQIQLGPTKPGPILVILDDIWDSNQLEKLVFQIPDLVTLIVSRFKFPDLIGDTYEMELLEEKEALSLFCRVAFEQENIPIMADKVLVKQVVAECKGLPLAVKVIGASLHGQKSPKIWAGARNRLSRGESISESHENRLLERMATSIECLSKKVRECFLDLGCFAEDRKIRLDLLMNIWMETHDLDEYDAFAILVELANKNLLTLVKDAENKAGDLYSCYSEISVTQHDVLRDLAIYIGNRDPVNSRKRLVMPRKEDSLPKEWERNKSIPFEAQIVSIHTGEMKESDWFDMCFPKAEVLILNFSSPTYFLPSFINTMENLKTLILINSNTQCATLENLCAFTTLNSLKSLWLEKLRLPPLSKTTIPLKTLTKVSLMQCELKSSLKGSKMDLSVTFPRLSDLTLDHCIDLKELPSSICDVVSLSSLTISNCHELFDLPNELGKLSSLQILRVYSCPYLKKLPQSIGGLRMLKYLDISQCVNVKNLPDELGHVVSLEKIDMRECSQLRSLPRSYSKLKSLRHVVCDEELAPIWKEAGKKMLDLRIQVAEESYDLDWIVE